MHKEMVVIACAHPARKVRNSSIWSFPRRQLARVQSARGSSLVGELPLTPHTLSNTYDSPSTPLFASLAQRSVRCRTVDVDKEVGFQARVVVVPSGGASGSA